MLLLWLMNGRFNTVMKKWGLKTSRILNWTQLDLCVKASLMLIIHCGRLKKPLCCRAFKFSTLEVKPQYKLAKYAWQCSCAVGDQIYTEKKTFQRCSCMWCGHFTVSSMILGYSMRLKTITTVIQMYSNSLLSQSIQTPNSAATNTSLLFTNASCCGNTESQGLASFTTQQFSSFFFLQMIQLKCVKMMREMWNEDPFPKQACRPA